MNENFTPLKLDDINKKDTGLNTAMLLIATFTALVLAILLFVLIQKKVNQTQVPSPEITPSPTIIIPTLVPTITIVASPSVSLKK